MSASVGIWQYSTEPRFRGVVLGCSSSSRGTGLCRHLSASGTTAHHAEPRSSSAQYSSAVVLGCSSSSTHRTDPRSSSAQYCSAVPAAEAATGAPALSLLNLTEHHPRLLLQLPLPVSLCRMT